jgi:hypothetical protein
MLVHNIQTLHSFMGWVGHGHGGSTDLKKTEARVMLDMGISDLTVQNRQMPRQEGRGSPLPRDSGVYCIDGVMDKMFSMAERASIHKSVCRVIRRDRNAKSNDMTWFVVVNRRVHTCQG